MVAMSKVRSEVMKIKLEIEKTTDSTGGGSTLMTDDAKAVVQAALDEVNGKATAFTVCFAS